MGVRSKWILAVVSICLVVGAGLAGYLTGAEAAPSPDEAADAKAEAESVARKAATVEARDESESEGIKSGRAQGNNDGLQDGQSDGARAGASRVQKLEEQESELASRPTTAPDCSDPSALPTPPGCPIPPDGPCGLYQDLQSDGSCGAKIPDPATPDECPPGWHPAGIYGACAPD